MNNKEKINLIIGQEFLNCDKFNHIIIIGNLELNINTKKINQSLIYHSSHFIGIKFLDEVNYEWLFNYNKLHESIIFPYNYLWLKIKKETGLDYYDSHFFVKKNLEEKFNINKTVVPKFWGIMN